MKVPLRWLQEFIDLPTTDVDELTYAFDFLGLTVEGVEEHVAGWSDVFVGKVTDIQPHPDADKIRVCQVDVGNGPSQIICGAWNFGVGAVVPVAVPGAILPGDFQIGQRTIRGVESNGMICSEQELGLGEDHAGILVLGDDIEIGVRLEDVLEVPDVVFELDVTPNRPDALSIMGVARDLAAWFDIEHHVPSLPMTTVPGATSIEVDIEDTHGCRRFTAREIQGVEIGPSPFKVRHRLHKVGVRSISNVVDVTNYVMFELGHPLHAFDADSIVGDRLVVKRADAGEKLVTLDGEERALVAEDLIIYDEDGPTSMSGTMGGERSEVSDTTSRVLMEAASWDPPTIMRMWRRYDLRSEAATRFERGVDPSLADVANQRASAMVVALSGGEVLEGAVDVVTTPMEPLQVSLAMKYVRRILGDGFDESQVSDILTRLGMTVEAGDPLAVTVPTFRPDLTRDADLIEEVARIHGFDKFDATLPTGPAGGLTVEQKRSRELVEALTAAGLDQAINLPFVNPVDLEPLGYGDADLLTVNNPLREEESKLRPTMLAGLLSSLRYNLSHGAADVGFFEIGRVFSTEPNVEDPRLPAQTDRLAWAVVGGTGMRGLSGATHQVDGSTSLALWRHLSRRLDLDDVAIEAAAPAGYHPGRSASLTLRGETIGHVGELAPAAARHYEISGRVAVAEIDLGPILTERAPALASAPSVYPFVDFDLSFLISIDQQAQPLLEVTVAAGGDLVESARVFDEFPGAGDGQKALAIRYRLRAGDRTLTNDEVAPVRQAMIEAADGLGAVLRGV